MGIWDSIEGAWEDAKNDDFGFKSVIEVGKTAEKKIETGAKELEKDVSKSYDTVVGALSNLEQGVVNGFQTIEDDIGIVIKGTKDFVEDDVIPLTKGLFKMTMGMIHGAEWIVDNYKIVLFIGGSYLAARYYNEVKTII